MYGRVDSFMFQLWVSGESIAICDLKDAIGVLKDATKMPHYM
jgi:hypothetical protein